MDATALQDGILLTILGTANTFLSVVIVILLVQGLRLLMQTGWAQRRMGAAPASGATPEQRNKALAAAIAVSVALAEAEATNTRDAPAGPSS